MLKFWHVLIIKINHKLGRCVSDHVFLTNVDPSEVDPGHTLTSMPLSDLFLDL